MDDSGSDSDEMRCEETFLVAWLMSGSSEMHHLFHRLSGQVKATDRRGKSNSNHIIGDVNFTEIGE